MSTLFIHVGPGKTGTTFLQDVVLERVHSVECLVKPTVNLGGEEVRFGDLFTFPPEVWGNSGGGAFSSLIEGRTEGKDLIISDEHVFGGVASPQPWIPDPTRKIGPIVRMCRQTNGKPDTYSMAAHLQRLSSLAEDWEFTDVKILAITRRQDTRLASGYAQVSDRVRGACQKGFEDWVRYLTQDPVGYYLGGGLKLDYLSWYEGIEKTVGKDGPKLLPFELLKENESEFVRLLLSWLDVKDASYTQIIEDIQQSSTQEKNVLSNSNRNWSLKEPVRSGPRLWSPRLFRLLRLPTRLPKRWPDFSRENEIRLTPDLSAEILNVYDCSNQQLDDKLPELGLGRYGYY